MRNGRRTIVIASMTIAVVLTMLVSYPVLAQGRSAQVLSNSVVNEPVQADVSAPLRDYSVGPITLSSRAHAPLKPKLQQLKGAGTSAGEPLQSLVGIASASVGLNFQGISGDPGSPATINCPVVSGVQLAPPDTNAAIGDTQIVQWVNICYSVYDKATGNLIAGPLPGNHFWSGFTGNVCGFRNDGDIIIQWDKANHVWVASQNVFNPWLTCIAVSKTADATGAYNRYAFTQPGLPDYPKWGLTSSIYYQTQNDFGPSGSGYMGVNVCAYDAAAMRAGKKNAKQVCILDNSNGTLFDDSMLPADTDAVPSSGGTGSEVLVGSIDNLNPGSDVYEYVMTVNMKKGTATLAGVNGSMPIAVPTYSLACGGFGACIPQPSPGSELLDALADRLMYRLAMFDDGTTQHFLVTHSVNDGVAVGARWYEFTAPEGSTSLSLAQSGQTPADGHYRWMGSIARDKFGDIALGYSRSSTAAGDYPSIYVSGQTAGETPGTTDPEVLVKQGSGSQFFTASRWGDYSSMALDGADHCTFLYTTEYYPFDGSFQWYTWLAAVKFPSCP
jgi:hypothetical protein